MVAKERNMIPKVALTSILIHLCPPKKDIKRNQDYQIQRSGYVCKNLVATLWLGRVDTKVIRLEVSRPQRSQPHTKREIESWGRKHAKLIKEKRNIYAN